VEDWNWEKIFTDIVGLSSTTVTKSVCIAIEFGEKYSKIKVITPFKFIQGVVKVGTNRKPVCDFLLVINSI